MCFLEEIKMKQNLMRLLARNRGRGQFEIKSAADGKEATVYLYDAIVATEEEAEWYGGVSAQSFVKQLAGLEADTIHLRINSPGGSVFAGRAMETALRQHSAKVIVYVDGLAASAASFVAMAGDEIEMAQGAFFMIHKAWSMAWGNSDELRKEADLLDKVDGSLAKTYHDRTGLPQPPSGGCVLKPACPRPMWCVPWQPPSCGCALKRRSVYRVPCRLPQPPSGGCALKRYGRWRCAPPKPLIFDLMQTNPASAIPTISMLYPIRYVIPNYKFI